MAQEMGQFFYNFCFPDDQEGFKNYGFYYLNHQADHIYSHTEFNTPEGIYRNIFNLKIKGKTVTAYKHNDGAWIDVQENHFPTSAYPMLLPLVAIDEPLHYLGLAEDTGELIGEATLTRQGNDIVETVRDKVMRRFTMGQVDSLYVEQYSKVSADFPIYIPKSIDWGGAKSFLCSNVLDAVEGTSFKILELLKK